MWWRRVQSGEFEHSAQTPSLLRELQMNIFCDGDIDMGAAFAGLNQAFLNGMQNKSYEAYKERSQRMFEELDAAEKASLDERRKRRLQRQSESH
jgi:hypothetical protein